jgi:uncharacterized membrane protein YoaK (UPF0700 family)
LKRRLRRAPRAGASMKSLGGPAAIAALLSFTAGYVDTAGFLGLQGLFTAHVTGNFVTLGATLVLGSKGIIGKILALPEFVAMVALARMAGHRLRARNLPARRFLFAAEAVLLTAFFALAIGFGPFPDPDSPAALLTGFAAIAAMAVQNGVQRVHLPNQPPTTIMTGNTTQATIDFVDLAVGRASGPTRPRLLRTAFGILIFAAGCALAALLYWRFGFWCLVVPVLLVPIAALKPADAS